MGGYQCAGSLSLPCTHCHAQHGQLGLTSRRLRGCTPHLHIVPAPILESDWSMSFHCLRRAGTCAACMSCSWPSCGVTRQKPLRHGTWVMLAELDLFLPALQPVNYSSSVDIRPEWSVVEQIPFSSLTKLNFTVAKPEEVTCCTHHAAACACKVALVWQETGEPLPA